MECPDFASAGGPNATWKEKTLEACTACNKCKGNAPINPDEESSEDEEIDSLIGEVEELVTEQDADPSIRTDDYTIWRLLVVWREAEKQVQMIQQARMQSFLRAWMTEK